MHEFFFHSYMFLTFENANKLIICVPVVDSYVSEFWDLCPFSMCLVFGLFNLWDHFFYFINILDNLISNLTIKIEVPFENNYNLCHCI